MIPGLRIVQAVGWYFPGSVGGTEVYVAALCGRLREAGHEVIVAVPDPTLATAREDEHDGVPVFRYPVPRLPTRDEAQGETIARGAVALHELLRARRPDVVHLHTIGVGLGNHELRAARAAGARAFVTAHESRLGHLCQRGDLMRDGRAPCDGMVERAGCAACALQQRGLPPSLARLAAALPPSLSRAARRLPGRAGTALSMSDLIARNLERQRELLGLVDRLVLLTQAALEIAVANGAPREKLALNRLGVRAAFAVEKPARDPAAPVHVGYLGRFDRVKGAAVLADAVARLPPSLPLRVTLRGPVRTDEERRIADEVRARARGDARLAIEPEVAPDAVPALLASWDLLCCPSLCLEGGPTVALEAHAVGTPVIGSRIGGLAELVRDDCGALFPPGDAPALASLLTRIATDPANTIDRWRPALPPPRTMDDVARDTLAMYEDE